MPLQGNAPENVDVCSSENNPNAQVPGGPADTVGEPGKGPNVTVWACDPAVDNPGQN